MSIFVQLSLIIVLASVIAGVMKLLKQPLIIGHIISGLIVGQFLVTSNPHTTETINIFKDFGVAILLFIVGLQLSPKAARDVGKTAIIVGLAQITLTGSLSYAFAYLLGLGHIQSMYIAAALSFSSTVVALKLLADKHDLENLHGKIAIGILLVQDIIAALVLVFASAASNQSTLPQIGLIIIKGTLFTSILILIAHYILPKLENFFAQSQEYLFLFSIAWGFGLASAFSLIGFSIEIGALIAGVALSVSPFNQEVSAKLRSLRDFFVVAFFVFLGSQVQIQQTFQILPTVFIFTCIAFLAKPLIISILMLDLEYNTKTSYLTSTSLAQISELSLILVLVGFELGHLSADTLATITFVGIISIAASTYFSKYSLQIYPKMSRYLKPLEKPRPQITQSIMGSYEVVLFGANRIGYDFLEAFKKHGQAFLAIDYNPQIVRQLKKDGINCMYGDAEDLDFLQEINIKKAKMVVSTIPEFDVNLQIIHATKDETQKTIVIVVSYSVEQALKLYESGASYVVLPHFLSGHFTSLLTTKHWFDLSKFEVERANHIKYLKERINLGHKHPKHV